MLNIVEEMLLRRNYNLPVYSDVTIFSLNSIQQLEVGRASYNAQEIQLHAVIYQRQQILPTAETVLLTIERSILPNST